MSSLEGRIVFVTSNPGKLKEVREILANGPQPLEIESQGLDLPEIQGTTHEIAREKCRRAAELIGHPVITEDTALCFTAMNGLPGPYIKFFMLELGHEGLNRMLDGFSTRAAWALCTFAYSAGPGTEPILFEGRTDGKIVAARGPAHFGWDPVFEAEDTGLTYAEMEATQKNAISHRGRALRKLRDYLQAPGTGSA